MNFIIKKLVGKVMKMPAGLDEPYNASGFLQDLYDTMTNQTYLVNVTAGWIHFLMKVVACVILYYIGVRIVKKMLPVLNKFTSRKNIHSSLGSFLKSMINVGARAILITMCLLILGVKESSLVAFFGTLGIGVGLALKDNLSNLAGGIIIVTFNIYKVGDEVRIADEMGFIHSIDVLFTAIKTHNDDIIMVPNGMVVSNKVINYDMTPYRRLKLIIGVDYNCDLTVARNTLENILRRNPLVLKDPAPYTHVDSYGDSSINIALKGYIMNENYWTVYKQTLNEIKEELDKVGVGIPFPQMDLHLDREVVDNLKK